MRKFCNKPGCNEPAVQVTGDKWRCIKHAAEEMPKLARVTREVLSDQSLVWNVCIGNEVVATPRKEYEADAIARAINALSSDPCIVPDLFLLDAITNLKMRADGYALGAINIFGVPHHAQFIRVRYDNGVQTCDGDSDEARENWESAKELYDARFQTVRVPGLEGEWVCVIHPCGD